jgi:uncharacterized protein (DUF1800 family)
MAERNSSLSQPRVLATEQLHLLRRLTYGVNEQALADFHSAGSPTAWLNRQLSPALITDTQADAIASWFPRLADSAPQAWDNAKRQEVPSWEYGLQFAQWTTARRVVSRRQLLEVMTDVWSNLLYIPVGEDRSFPWRMDFDRVIRANALGTYRALLRAAVVHPAMSGWLNNSVNTKHGINENLGRELLELYTVGAASGYTEDDVKNSARILTGFKVKVFDGYQASYSPDDHWTGPVQVLGFSHHNTNPDGRAVVNAYLDYLARHASTAAKIARRLCVRFVSDDPPADIINAVATAYRTSDTSIGAALKAMVGHPQFASSVGGKVRTPIEDVVNAMRVCELTPTGVGHADALIRQSIWMAQGLGQYMHSWPRPDGFPETSSTWASAARVLRGWDVHLAIAAGGWGAREFSTPPKAQQLPTSWPMTLAQIVDHQARMLLGRPAQPTEIDSVAWMLLLDRGHTFASADDFNDWYWVLVRTSLLNTPEGIVR